MSLLHQLVRYEPALENPITRRKRQGGRASVEPIGQNPLPDKALEAKKRGRPRLTEEQKAYRALMRSRGAP